jgi:hypothetical protein
MEDEPFQEPKENVSVKITKNRNLENIEEKMKENFKSYMHKDYFGNQIIKMHYVGHFIVLMIIKRLI